MPLTDNEKPYDPDAALEAYYAEKAKEITELNDDTFDSFLVDHQPRFIMFMSPSCKHCHTAGPQFGGAYVQLVEEGFNHIKFAVINARDNPKVREKYEINGFPKFMYFHGRDHLTYTGTRNREAFYKFILRILNKGGKMIKSIKEAANWKEKFEWSVWLFSEENSKAHSAFDQAIKNLSGPQYLAISNPTIAESFNEEMESIVIYKKYDDGIVKYTGNMLDPDEIKAWILASYMPRIKSTTYIHMASQIFNNATNFILFSEADDPAVTEINKIGLELNEMFDGVARLDINDMELDDRFITSYGANKILAEQQPFLAINDCSDADYWKHYKYEDQDDVLTVENMLQFANDWKNGNATRHYRGGDHLQPIPQKNRGVAEINLQHWDEIKSNSTQLTIVNFYERNACVLCKSLVEMYHSLAQLIEKTLAPNVFVAKMDTYCNELPGHYYQWDDAPHYKVFYGGTDDYDEFTGPVDGDALYDFVKLSLRKFLGRYDIFI